MLQQKGLRCLCQIFMFFMIVNVVLHNTVASGSDEPSGENECYPWAISTVILENRSEMISLYNTFQNDADFCTGCSIPTDRFAGTYCGSLGDWVFDYEYAMNCLLDCGGGVCHTIHGYCIYASEAEETYDPKKESEKCPSNKVTPQDRAGNPINFLNYNNIEKVTDIDFPTSFSVGFKFYRTYKSKLEKDSSMGYGWTHNYNIPMYHMNEGFSDALTIEDEEGRKHKFLTDADSQPFYLGISTAGYVVKHDDGTLIWHRMDMEYVFNADMRFVEKRDEDGNTQTLSYNNDNLLESVIDNATGRTLTFQYNSNNKIESISGPITPSVPDGIYVLYEYDSNGNLTLVTYADDNNGSSASGYDYSYTDTYDPHNLTQKNNLAGELLSTWSYHSNDDAYKSETRDGNGVTITPQSGGVVELVYQNGAVKYYRTIAINASRRVVGSYGGSGCTSCSGDGISEYEYDADGNIIATKYVNGRVDRYYDFDGSGRYLRKVENEGTEEERTFVYTLHPVTKEWMSLTETSVLGTSDKVTIWDFDNDGNDTPNEDPTTYVYRKIEQGFTYDSTGTIVPYVYITSFDYDDKGRITNIDGPLPGNQDQVIYQYDTDPATSYERRIVTSPIIGNLVGLYDAAGNLVQTTDHNGIVTTIQYDGRKRPVTITKDGISTHFTYTAAGEINNMTDGAGRVMSYFYNTSGFLGKIQDGTGGYIMNTYDGLGQLEENSIYNSANELLKKENYTYLTTEKPGKLHKIINPNGSFTELTYTSMGSIESVKDPMNNTTTYEYDPMKRLSAVIQPGNISTLYSYDGAGNLVKVTDPNNNDTEYVYDDSGRLVKTVSPDTGTTTYTYDEAGNIVSKTDHSGQTTGYTYDTLGRLTSILYSDSSQDVIYLYDQGINGNGKLTGISDGTGSYSFIHDTMGNLVTTEKTTYGQTYTTSYSYDNTGQLTGMTYPDGREVIYSYDDAGKISSVTTVKNGIGQDIALNMTHMPFGPLKSLEFGNGQTLDKGFDLQYRPDTMSAPGLVDWKFGLDNAGNITGITDNLDSSKTKGFGYDNLYRLTSATGSFGTASYTYDNVGNRLTKTLNGDTQTYTYISDSNKLDNITGSEALNFGYDSNGNIATKGSQTLIYNQNNRLIRLEENSQIMGEYTYNSKGQRIKKTAGDSTTIFHYDIFGKIIAESNPEGIFTRSYIYLGNERLAAITDGAETDDFIVSLIASSGRNLEGIKIYAFSESGSYTGHFAVTDHKGNAIFQKEHLSNESYKFRADYLNEHFWSDVVEVSSDHTSIDIQEVEKTVSVLQNDSGIEGIKVYLFDENGSYLGIYGITDENGNVTFTLPLGQEYKFRADILRIQYFSDTITIDDSADVITVNSGGGVITFSLDKGNSEALANVKTYLFSATGSYLGKNSTTDENGNVNFAVSTGTFKIRCDYLGYQFWSENIFVDGSRDAALSIPHQDVVITVNQSYQSVVTPIEGVKTYLFNETGSYLGLNATTEATGKVTFSLPEKAFKFRADFLGDQYWSDALAWTDKTIDIQHGTANVTVTNLGSPVTETKVYLFSSTGSYLGLNATTDASGQASFMVPEGDYKVRADWLGSQYWSEVSHVNPDMANAVPINIGGGVFKLTVKKDSSTPIEGLKCYLFNDSGSYLGNSGTTTADGEVSFTLGAGNYKVRMDYMGHQFWTNIFASPYTTELEHIIPHSLITITVNRVYGTGSGGGGDDCPEDDPDCDEGGGGNDDCPEWFPNCNECPEDDPECGPMVLFSGTESDCPEDDPDCSNEDNSDNDTGETIPLEGIKVYLFTESGSYLGVNATTDSLGQVTFEVPEESYKSRADYMAGQYWSEPFIWDDETISISEGEANVTVSQNGNPISGVKVYVFSETGSYQGINATTDTSGIATFRLPAGTWKYRADYLGSQYWATEALVTGQVDNIAIDTNGAAFSLTVQTDSGESITGIKVYAFSSTGSYLGLNETTDASGTVSFDLSEGDYKFRADYLGYQFWTEVQSIPGTVSLNLDIPHQDVTFTVNSRYQTDDSIQEVRVYLFTESGSYLGQNTTTDANGQVTFSLPAQSYKVRADYMSQQYWSNPVVQLDDTVIVDHAVANIHVSLANVDVSGAKVYLFSSTGSYLGKVENTNSGGNTQFTLPVNEYKFRVDYDGTQYWSDATNLIAYQENDFELDLDLLALNETANPHFARVDGKTPEYHPALILLASTAVDSDYMANTTRQTNKFDYLNTFYFINDHLGTSIKVVDYEGIIVWDADYEPFGKADASISTFGNNFRFPGQYQDDETGLHYNWHRYYDPVIGRYLTPDPIGIAGGINLFEYVRNNPISAIDPKGLNSIKGQWIRKPYVENINVDGLLSGIEMPEDFNPTPETATLIYLNFTVSGDVGFTVYCQEFDECGEETRYWYVSKKCGVSKKMRVPIKVHQKPSLMRLIELAVYLKEKFSWTTILMEHANDVNSMINETPTKICEMIQK